MKRMKLWIALAAAVTMVVSLSMIRVAAGPAHPHFKTTSVAYEVGGPTETATNVDDEGSELAGDVLADFLEVGLGTDTNTTTVTLTGTLDVVWQCLNGGGNPPHGTPSGKFATSSTPLQSPEATVNVGNGQASGQLEIQPSANPQPPKANCPGNGTWNAISGSWSNLTLVDSNTGATSRLGSLSSFDF